MKKTLIAFLTGLTLLGAGTCGVIAGAPAVPADTPVLREATPVKQCGGNWGYYVKDYDTNPNSPNALYRGVGIFEVRDGEHPIFGPILLAIVTDDEGAQTVYFGEEKFATVDEAITKYGKDLCTFPGFAPPPSEQFIMPRGENARP